MTVTGHMDDSMRNSPIYQIIDKHTHISGNKPRGTWRWPDGWHTPGRCVHRPSHGHGWRHWKTSPENTQHKSLSQLFGEQNLLRIGFFS